MINLTMLCYVVGKIKMHQIRSTDIVEGNMKSIMRLILALAAHFKVCMSICPCGSGIDIEETAVCMGSCVCST